jgi:hypothetical protein
MNTGPQHARKTNAFYTRPRNNYFWFPQSKNVLFKRSTTKLTSKKNNSFMTIPLHVSYQFLQGVPQHFRLLVLFPSDVGQKFSYSRIHNIFYQSIMAIPKQSLHMIIRNQYHLLRKKE